jgi:two-component system, OmpR family, KDP operon response regulator KdpE
MLNHPRILVADADPGICRLLRRHFGAASYTVVTAETGREALDLIRRTPPDLAILSTELDDFGGTEMIRRVRGLCSAPIIALMRPGGSLTPTQVLDSGADDCIDEPFLLKELAARVRRLLQRVGAWQGPSVVATGLGPIEVDPLERRVRIGGKLVALTRKEFDLLSLLVGAKGGTLSHDEIVQRVWGRGYSGARQNLRRTISSLRHKIEPDAAHPAHLLSVRGSGYRLRVRSGANVDPEPRPSSAADSPGSGTRSR